MPFCIFIHSEYSRTYYTIRSGRKNHWPLGAWEKLPAAPSATGTNHSDDSRWYLQPHDRSSTGNLSTYCPTVAAAFLVPAMCRIGKRCTSPWSHSENLFAENQSYRRGNSPDNAFQCDALEHTNHGQSTGRKRSNDTSDMEATQSQAPPGQNLQTQSRPTFLREARRRCWALSESPGQVLSALCRRKKPNSSTRPHPAGPSIKERPLRDHDPRLQTQWHHDIVCGPEHAQRQGDRRLHAASSAPRVHSISQKNRCRNIGRVRSPFDRGQLWYPQTSASEILAPSPSPIPSAFYSNFKFLVEPRGTMVSRTDRQTSSPGKLSKRTGIDRRYQTISGQSQSKPTSLCMECLGQGNHAQNRQM